jgi:hypothetical protein
VIGAFLVLAFTGLLPTLPPALHLLILIGFAAALGYFGYRAVQGLRAPAADAAARRLERDSGLAHRPLSVLADRPAGDDPMAQALWLAQVLWLVFMAVAQTPIRRRATKALFLDYLHPAQ